MISNVNIGTEAQFAMMTREDIGFIASRLIAVWLFAQAMFLGAGWAIYFLTAIFLVLVDPTSTSPASVSTAAVGGIPAVAMAIVGSALWFWAPRISRFIIPRERLSNGEREVVPKDVLTIGLILIGVLTMVSVLRDVVGIIVELMLAEEPFAEFWGDAVWHSNVWSVVGGVIGASLVVGARRFGQYLMG